MSKDLGSLLKKAVRPPRTVLDVDNILERSLRATRWKRFQFGLTLVVLMVMAGVLTAYLSNPETNVRNGLNVSAGDEGVPESEQDRFETEPKTDEFSVQGEQLGRAWELRVLVADLTVESSGNRYPIPCLGFEYAGGDDSGTACHGSKASDMGDGDGPPFLAIEDQGTGDLTDGDAAYYGITPSETRTVELRHENGEVTEAGVFEVEPDIGDFKLFVGFQPGKGAVDVVALDSDGKEVGSQSFTDGF